MSVFKKPRVHSPIFNEECVCYRCKRDYEWEAYCEQEKKVLEEQFKTLHALLDFRTNNLMVSIKERKALEDEVEKLKQSVIDCANISLEDVRANQVLAELLERTLPYIEGVGVPFPEEDRHKKLLSDIDKALKG